MSLSGAWEKAIAQTEMIRTRLKPLETFTSTHLPYILLSESKVNPGDTVSRSGKLSLEKPQLILPSHSPQFSGFDFEESTGVGADWLTNFLLVRGVSLPSLKYSNQTMKLEVMEGRLEKSISRCKEDLKRREDIATTLLTGPDEYWPLSLIIFVAGLVVRSAHGDLRRIMDKFREGTDPNE